MAEITFTFSPEARKAIPHEFSSLARDDDGILLPQMNEFVRFDKFAGLIFVVNQRIFRYTRAGKLYLEVGLDIVRQVPAGPDLKLVG